MCLSNVSEVKTRVKDGYITAWKVIHVDNTGDFQRECQFVEGINKDKTRRKFLCAGYKGRKYKVGFHCWKTRAAARTARSWTVNIYDRKIVKVLINPENVVATGEQFGYEVIVANEIEIPSLKHCR